MCVHVYVGFRCASIADFMHMRTMFYRVTTLEDLFATVKDSWAVHTFMILWIYHGLINFNDADFNDGQQQVPSLQDLFKTVKPGMILCFLKQLPCTGFYEELVIA